MFNLSNATTLIVSNKKRGHRMGETAHTGKEAYWKAVKRLTASLLLIWFLVSFGAGILFRELLDNVSLGGAPLGFWFAQNGAIYVFVLLIIIYCRRMTALDRKFGMKD